MVFSYYKLEVDRTWGIPLDIYFDYSLIAMNKQSKNKFGI